jgi:hypothetical protein
MRCIFAFFCLFIFVVARADQDFANYEDYYRQLGRTVFSSEPLKKPNDAYSFKGEHGLCGEEDSCQDYHGKIGSRKIKISISLTNGGFKINNHRFDYRSARRLLGSEKIENDAPLHVDAVYVAKKIKNRPDMACIEGRYAGTAAKYNFVEVFLILNPLGSQTTTQVAHLPGLLASCLSIRQWSDGSVIYPINSYLPNNLADGSEGLMLRYFKLNGESTHESRVRFVERGNPFRFSVE